MSGYFLVSRKLVDRTYVRYHRDRNQPTADTTAEQYAEWRGIDARERQVAEAAVELIRAHMAFKEDSEPRASFEGETAAEYIESALPDVTPCKLRAVGALAIKLAEEAGVYGNTKQGGQPAVDDETAQEIRDKAAQDGVTHAALGEEYDISSSLVAKIVQRRGCYGD